MGWSGGTNIFDKMYEELSHRQYEQLSEFNIKGILRELVEVLWSLDWDVEDESKYFYDSPLVKELFQEMYEDHGIELDEDITDIWLDEPEYSDDQLAERRAEQRAEDWITGFDRGDY